MLQQPPTLLLWSTRNSITLNLMHVSDLVTGKIKSEKQRAQIIFECKRFAELLSDKKVEYQSLKEVDQDEVVFHLDNDLKSRLVHFYLTTRATSINFIRTLNGCEAITVLSQVKNLIYRLTFLNEIPRKSRSSCKVSTRTVGHLSSAASTSFYRETPASSFNSPVSRKSIDSNNETLDSFSNVKNYRKPAWADVGVTNVLPDSESSESSETSRSSSTSDQAQENSIGNDIESELPTNCDCKSELAVLKSELENLKEDINSRPEVKKVFKINVGGERSIIKMTNVKVKVGSFNCLSLPWSLWISSSETRGLFGKKKNLLNIYVKCDYNEAKFSTKFNLKLKLFNKSSYSNLVFYLHYNKIKNSNMVVGKYGVIDVKDLTSNGFVINEELTIGVSLEAKKFFKAKKSD